MKRTEAKYGTKWLSFLLIVLLLYSVTAQCEGEEMMAQTTVSSIGTVNFPTFGPEDILFEFGAELKNVGDTPKPPFQMAGPTGSGATYGYVRVSDEQARSGTKSVKFYQPSPTKSDADRRVLVREYRSGTHESYLSWWVYFTPSLTTQYRWRSFGGLRMRYGPSENKLAYRNYITFAQQSDNDIIVMIAQIFCPAVQPKPTGEDVGEVKSYDTGYDVEDLINGWHQLEVYMKMSNTTDGIYRAWIDGNLVKEQTGKITDPRGHSRWTSENCDWLYEDFPYISIAIYNERDEPECWYYVDDIVMSTTYVPSSYSLGGQYVPPELSIAEMFEDGFESGDFSNWNGTQYAKGGSAPTVTSRYAHQGTYSANFTTDGTADSYARAMHTVQNVTQIYQRSWIRFSSLPDANNSRLLLQRLATSDGTWIASCGVYNLSNNIYWSIDVTPWTAEPENYTLTTINVNNWHCVEFYFNATTNGNATVWINGTVTCEYTADFSALGDIGRVYPYLFVAQASQGSSRSVFHDNFRVDTRARVGYQASEGEYWEDGFESGDFSAWNRTEAYQGSASVTSTYAWDGTYSANLTTNGAQGSYARVMHAVTNCTAIYVRSKVRFGDLPDTDETRLMVLRIAQDDGDFLSNAGVYRNSTGYYWMLRVMGTPVFVATTSDTINADTYYDVEIYLNITTNGNATLWVDNVKKCELTGDFSGLGYIGRVYPYLYCADGNQASSKTVYHDNFRVGAHARVGDQASGWGGWEDGFESGDFSAWNRTEAYQGSASVTSTYAWDGTYSASFTAVGAYGYAGAMKIIQNATEIYQRSYVRFEDLPDTDDARIWVLSFTQSDGTWIGSAGVYRSGGNYYWTIGYNGGVYNDARSARAINTDQWYEMEFYFNATSNGKATLWINGALTCELTGDFSGLGNIARVYPCIGFEGNNTSAITVYHDNYRVDDVRIGSKTPMPARA